MTRILQGLHIFRRMSQKIRIRVVLCLSRSLLLWYWQLHVAYNIKQGSKLGISSHVELQGNPGHGKNWRMQCLVSTWEGCVLVIHLPEGRQVLGIGGSHKGGPEALDHAVYCILPTTLH